MQAWGPEFDSYIPYKTENKANKTGRVAPTYLQHQRLQRWATWHSLATQLNLLDLQESKKPYLKTKVNGSWGITPEADLWLHMCSYMHMCTFTDTWVIYLKIKWYWDRDRTQWPSTYLSRPTRSRHHKDRGEWRNALQSAHSIPSTLEIKTNHK